MNKELKKTIKLFQEMLEDEVENKLFKEIGKDGFSIKWFKIHNWKENLKQKLNEVSK